MKGYLSKNPDNRYVISRWRPKLLPVFGTDREAFYPTDKMYHGKWFGEPLWRPDQCSAVIEAQLRKHGHALLEPGESRQFPNLAFLLD